MTAFISNEDVGEVYAVKLKEEDMNSVATMLGRWATPQRRKNPIKTTEFSDKVILEWTSRANNEYTHVPSSHS